MLFKDCGIIVLLTNCVLYACKEMRVEFFIQKVDMLLVFGGMEWRVLFVLLNVQFVKMPLSL